MLFSILFSLGVLEVALRIVFANNQSFLIHSYLDRPYLYNTKYWKVWHYPNSESKHRKDCFDVVYKTNSLGLRGAELKIDATYRIALLGDSFVEGFGVNNNQTFSHLLDSISGKDIEVLNFGTSGGFGTVNELALYENFARHFSPDLVILFYLNYNDVQDNINSISDGLISKSLEFTYPTGTKEEVFAEIKAQTQPKPTSAIISSFYVTSLANKGLRVFKLFIQSAVNMKADFQSGLTEIYSTEANDQLQIGYDIAKKSIERLNKLVSKDSANLVLVNLSDPYQIDKNWISATEFKYDLKLDPE